MPPSASVVLEALAELAQVHVLARSPKHVQFDHSPVALAPASLVAVVAGPMPP